ncbi:hypothetical protein COCMIDRAFT_88920 [Bipolaris oryzae ATCC 44560]|uniref:Uncharacterized protein n=1 Tax=Bipolaris oryzae ATCC 44560 TaxID=930090 RepID=W6ZVP2_COCMI|nr:uncharacterized protein COCMIDRAFT_88920 [Bipolaris oryzae ATCC 44560]EUC47846.1 hypothetical protein COCMIDRAFT_88920 [Bipolaris oryzae ATCC 44560]
MQADIIVAFRSLLSPSKTRKHRLTQPVKPWRRKGIPTTLFDELWRGGLRKSRMDGGAARPIGIEGRSCGEGVIGLVLAMAVFLRQRLNCPWHCWCVDGLIGG